MKTEDIRKMGLAYVQVQEASKKKDDDDMCPDCGMDHEKGECKMDEALIGNQHKIDANKNGKVDAHDFKLLRKGKKVTKEAKAEWPVFKRIQEKAAEIKKGKAEISNVGDDFASDIKASYAKHTKGATDHEGMHDKLSQGEKDFVAKHGGMHGNDSGISADKAAELTSKAISNSVKQAPGRHNDQKIGDKTPPKASA